MSAFNDGFNAGIKAAAEVVNSRRFGGEQDLRSIRASIEYLKPPAPAANDPWKSAVIDALVTAHIYTTAHESDPRGALKALLAYEQAVALDPAVSSDAAALIERGRAEADACVAALRGMRVLIEILRTKGKSRYCYVEARDGHLVRVADIADKTDAALRAYDERSGQPCA